MPLFSGIASARYPAVIRILVQENRSLLQWIRRLSGKTTRQKVMSYLSSQALLAGLLAGSSEFRIPLNRQEMAS